MKKVLSVAVIAASVCFFNVSFGQKAVLSMGDYSISVLTEPAREAGQFGFIQAMSVNAKKGEEPFGFWYSGAVLELKDAATKKTIATVTADELANGKSEAVTGGTQTTYTVGKGGKKFDLMIESVMKPDAGMPLGEMLVVSFKVKGVSAAKVSAELKMKTDGAAEKLGTSGIAVNRIVKDIASYPAIVLTAVKPVKITVSKRLKKELQQNVSIESANISLSAAEWSSLCVFDVNGSTVDDAVKSVAQAHRIINHVSAKESTPEVVMFNRTSSPTTTPGDTITFTISYVNIGSGTATDAEITNPIPAGTVYLEGSAAGDGTEVSIDRKPAAGNQLGEAALVRWKVTKAIFPGEGGSVSMKAVVR
ncbi:MAG: DUF11 domain-containing protein [Bacteroidota bacterium]|nr:DUF11 domain-containing protein [Bacteroidota bacterium]